MWWISIGLYALFALMQTATAILSADERLLHAALAVGFAVLLLAYLRKGLPTGK